MIQGVAGEGIPRVVGERRAYQELEEKDMEGRER